MYFQVSSWSNTSWFFLDTSRAIGRSFCSLTSSDSLPQTIHLIMYQLALLAQPSIPKTLLVIKLQEVTT